LQSGDVIRSVNGEKVEDLEAMMKIYEKSTKAKETRVLMEVKRGRGVRRAVLKVD
jgi:C-terminal processing protease CtpA/Prc